MGTVLVSGTEAGVLSTPGAGQQELSRDGSPEAEAGTEFRVQDVFRDPHQGRERGSQTGEKEQSVVEAQ